MQKILLAVMALSLFLTVSVIAEDRGVITADFIKRIEKNIGYKIEYVPDASNDYGDCECSNKVGHCRYWFMEEGKSVNSSPAMLDFDIFKVNDAEKAERLFDSEMRNMVGWKITDEGDIPLRDESYDLNIGGYKKVRKFSMGRNIILALINNWFFKLDYDQRISDEKITVILNELKDKIL
ncbi:MAG: hypothetical protein QME65_05525 [Candidatus Omnitrophota bacterium]|nr:hypothetical protein [Candidatus Omnitrophota bacterium]